MFNQKQLVAFIGILVVHDIYINVMLFQTASRCNNIIDQHVARQDAQIEQIDYLCHLLKKHDVPLTEFDIIALNNPTL